MKLEFDYTPDDLKEARGWQAAQKRRKMRFGRGFFGWLLFVAMAALVFVWIKGPQSGSTTPATTPDSGWEMFVATLPWVFLAVAVLAFILIMSARRHLVIWKKYVHIRQTQTFVFEDEGVRTGTVFYDSLYRWPFFVRWGESRNLLLLVMPGDLHLFIPKRALPGEQELEQLQQILRSHVREAAGGFPVGPPRPALPLVEETRHAADSNTSSDA